MPSEQRWKQDGPVSVHQQLVCTPWLIISSSAGILAEAGGKRAGIDEGGHRPITTVPDEQEWTLNSTCVQVRRAHGLCKQERRAQVQKGK